MSAISKLCNHLEMNTKRSILYTQIYTSFHSVLSLSRNIHVFSPYLCRPVSIGTVISFVLVHLLGRLRITCSIIVFEI